MTVKRPIRAWNDRFWNNRLFSISILLAASLCGSVCVWAVKMKIMECCSPCPLWIDMHAQSVLKHQNRFLKNSLIMLIDSIVQIQWLQEFFCYHYFRFWPFEWNEFFQVWQWSGCTIITPWLISFGMERCMVKLINTSNTALEPPLEIVEHFSARSVTLHFRKKSKGIA